MLHRKERGIIHDSIGISQCVLPKHTLYFETFTPNVEGQTLSTVKGISYVSGRIGEMVEGMGGKLPLECLKSSKAGC